MDFIDWQSDVNSALRHLFGETAISQTRLASGLVVWRLHAAGTTVTAGPDERPGLIYLSFSDARPNMLVMLEPDSARAARYIATRLAEN